MKIQNIKLALLKVNRTNDRHGELIDEDAAIDWLLKHRTLHMRNLTADIVASGEIYEPPLVHKEGDNFVVYDGNRRTTVLKLLDQPQLAPSKDWAEFFSKLRAKWSGKFPSTIACQVENNRERLDEILYRRHTGQQRGVGQSQWDAEAKSYFEKRTGKRTKINVAEEIEKILHGANRLTPEQRVPRSNLNRLLSAEQFRNRAGVAVDGNKLKFTHEEEKVLVALTRIAQDLISRKKTLDDIWDNNAKRIYLNELDQENVLPKAKDALADIVDAKPNPAPAPDQRTPDSPSPEPEKRRHLIRNLDFGLEQTHQNRRALDIFTELQHHLKFDEHDNAIAVLFRVLLELSMEAYIEAKHVPDIQKGDRLSNKYRKVLSYMMSESVIDKKYHDSLKKFEKNDPIFSANTLHAYVHNADFFPSDHHLKNMWDTLEKFIIVCLKV